MPPHAREQPPIQVCLGIIFFLVYFFKKHKFLIIRSKSNAQIVCVKGDDSQYREFMKSVLQAAISVKKQ